MIVDVSIDNIPLKNHKLATEIITEYSSMFISVQSFGSGMNFYWCEGCFSKVTNCRRDQPYRYEHELKYIDIKHVTAFSNSLKVHNIRKGKGKEQFLSFNKGKLIQELQCNTTNPSGLKIEFSPDEEFFKNFVFKKEIVEEIVSEYSKCRMNSKKVA